MDVSQKWKESEISDQESLSLTRNLLRIAIFNISYIRGLFPEKYFDDISLNDMMIMKLRPMDAESLRLIDWMEKGVYDALQKKYLKTLLFCVCKTVEGPIIEEYQFSFSYSISDSQEVSMNVTRSGNNNGGTFNSTTQFTPEQMRNSASKMVRTLVQLMRTLDKMPEERTILMKLLYYNDVTPADYEPPFFRGCREQEAHHPWMKIPLSMEVGNVNSKYYVVALKALYHALPLNYNNVAKLQSTLEGEVNQNTASKLLDKMDCEVYNEPKSNRRLSKRIIHSDATEKKLIEAKALQIDSIEVEVNESLNPELNAFQNLGINQRDTSTCDNLSLIGTDLTRTKCQSEMHQNGSVRSNHTVSKGRDHVNTSTSRVETAASRESGIDTKPPLLTYARNKRKKPTSRAEPAASRESTIDTKPLLLTYARKRCRTSTGDGENGNASHFNATQ